MVDTARTLAQIKALLADNAGGDISAQDLRDMLESLVNPIPAGGGFGLGGRMQMYVSYAAGLTGASRPAIPAHGAYKFPLGSGNPQQLTNPINKDPEGWSDNTYSLVGTDPDHSYNPQWDWVVGDAVMLPPGVYNYSISMQGTNPFTSDLDGSPTKYVAVYLDQAEYDSDAPYGTPNLNPGPGYWYDQYFLGLQGSNAPDRTNRIAGSYTYPYTEAAATVINDRDVPAPFVLSGYASNQPDINYITYWDIRIVRLA